MTDSLYIAVDLFHAASYKPAANTTRPATHAAEDESYAHDEGFYYIVLQPFLIESQHTSSPSVSEYFDWNHAKLMEADRVTLLDRVLLERLAQQPASSVTPVPLPPDAQLSLRVTWPSVPAGFTRVRQLASDAELAFAPALWAEFAARNFMPVPVTKWEHIRATGHEEEVFAWAYGVMQALAAKTNRTAIEEEIFTTFFANAPASALPGDINAWRTHLTMGSPNKLELLLRHLRALSLEDEVLLRPPAFRFTPAELRQAGLNAFDPVPTGTYARRVWEEIRTLATASEQDGADALRRLFGFGERLRFPRVVDAKTERDFMLLKPDEDGWVVTNAHSLLGLAFRVGPIVAADAPQVDLVSLNVAGHELDTTGLDVLLRETVQEVGANPSRRFVAHLEPHAEGDCAWYLPRHGRPQAEGVATPEGKALFTVPGSLLDALDPIARADAPFGKDVGVLARTNPQRTLIQGRELALANGGAAFANATLYARTKVLLTRIPLANAPAGAGLWEISLSGSHSPFEQTFLDEALRAAGTDGSSALWIEQADGNGRREIAAFPLAGATVHSQNPVVLRLTEAADALSNLLPKRGMMQSGAAAAVERYAVDFAKVVRNGAPGAIDFFNAIATTDVQAPLLILAEHFEYRVSRSAERLLRRFGLSVTAQNGGGRTDLPVLAHVENFNKLRVDLLRADEEIRLNHPDANLPVAREGGDPAGSTFSYFVAHQFAEEVRVNVQEREASHYRAYRTAGNPWQVSGRIEHQYSHKLPIDGTVRIVLPLSTDVRNLAEQSTTVVATSSGGSIQEVVLPALTYDFDPGDPEQISLTIPAAYMRKLAADATATPAALRPLYEALMDLTAAAASGRASLVLERWNFDNTKRRPQAERIADPDAAAEFPGIVDDMRWVGTGVHLLSGSTGDLREVAPLVTSSFDAFAAAVKTAQDVVIRIPLTAQHWSWTPAPPAGPLFDSTNALRLGLFVDRDPARTIGSEFAQRDEQFLALPLDATARADSPDLDTVTATLRAAARADLAEYLQPDSPLRHSFGWIVSRDDEREQAVASNAIANGIDRDRALKLFGESYRFLNFPNDLSSANPTVVNLFYVPYAFKPLRVHPMFGDPQTTSDFAAFALRILRSLALGALPEEVHLQASTLDQAANARDRALQIGRGVAARLLRLLERVEPEATPQDTPLFQRVTRLLDAVDTTRKDVLTELFAADPSLFGTAKAIALGVFDPETYDPALYALRVRKRIREHAGAGINEVANDTDAFTFARFFGPETPSNEKPRRFLVDVLDDQSYDDDFHIFENDYRSNSGERGAPRAASAITKRGDARARSAEDLIEQVFHFDEDPSGSRSVEADVVHYNSEWEIVRPDGKLERKYLLPSRRFPRIPIPLLPAGDTSSRLSRMHPDLPASGDPQLDAQFARKLAASMPARVALRAFRSEDTMHAEPRLDTRATLTGAEARGWHCVDSYLSHYYFVVDANEEGSFENDVFEISVERQRTPFTPEPRESTATFEPVAGLTQWFVYDRRKEEQATGGAAGNAPKIEAPPDMTLGAVVDELESWLVTAVRPEAKGVTVLQEQDEPKDEPETAIYRPVKPAAQLENKTVGMKGRVVASELMNLVTTAGIDPHRRVLHLVVLDDVWQYQRVRVRVLRNGIDVNNNKRLDLRPIFQMVSRPSEWVDYARDVLRLDARRGDVPAAVAQLVSSITLAEWLASNAPIDVGPVVGNAIETRVGSTADVFFTRDEILRERNSVSGVVLQVIPDNHPRDRSIGSNAPDGRTDELPKLFLRDTAANTPMKLTAAVDRSIVKTSDPVLRVTWRNEQSVALLEVTWPLRWRS
jgi:hypothetical protein